MDFFGNFQLHRKNGAEMRFEQRFKHDQGNIYQKINLLKFLYLKFH